MRTGRALSALDMQAQAIITAPMTKTKSDPIANLRIQGIVQFYSRSGSAAPATRLRRSTSANQLIRSLCSRRGSRDPSCWCFSIRNGDAISSRAPRDGLFSFYSRTQPTECRKFVGTNRNNVWIVAADVKAHDLTIFVTQQDRHIVAITAERDVRRRVTDRCRSEQQKYDKQVFHKPVKMV